MNWTAKASFAKPSVLMKTDIREIHAKLIFKCLGYLI